MSRQLTYTDLAALMKKCAGVSVDPAALEDRPDTAFDEFGLDSLGLLAVVGELENRYGTPMEAAADGCRTPADFLGVINNSLTSGV